MTLFKPHEKVRIASDDPHLVSIRGELGVVLGSFCTPEGQRLYTVFVYEDEWAVDLREDDLETTGQYDASCRMGLPPFRQFQKVIVRSANPRYREINGKLGFINGLSIAYNGPWYFGVHFYGIDVGWCVLGSALVAAGGYEQEGHDYSGESIRVRVDEQGRGWLVEGPKDEPPEEQT